MILFPPCKINLGLHIVNKRIDGYHELDTFMYQIPFCDILEIIEAEIDEFSSSGLLIDVNHNDNLCMKALRLMREHYEFPFLKIHLHKIIPMGAGMGGGSANASYVILGINQLFNLNLSIERMQELSLKLGSDCPLFIVPKPQLAKGRGEVLSVFEKVNLKGYFLKIINVGIHISTKEAFSNVYFYKGNESIQNIISKPIETWRDHLKNDFERHIFDLHSILKLEKDSLYEEGAIYASMTGSGSTLYGIFKERPLANSTENRLELIIEL